MFKNFFNFLDLNFQLTKLSYYYITKIKKTKMNKLNSLIFQNRFLKKSCYAISFA